MQKSAVLCLLLAWRWSIMTGATPTPAPPANTSAPTPAPGPTPSPTNAETSKITLKLVFKVPSCDNATNMEKSDAVKNAIKKAGEGFLKDQAKITATVTVDDLTKKCDTPITLTAAIK